MEGSNPFREALETTSETQFALTGRDEASPAKRLASRTVAQMDLVSPERLKAIPKVAELTVEDLNDLAQEFSGIPSKNPRVADLTLEDISDLEAVFFDFKVAAGRELHRAGDLKAASVDVSCCCCTPCCCCAATDMSVTA